MSTKSEKDRTKQIQDKCQAVLNELLRDEDNKYCVDCDTKGPRWASWNLGVFLCIRCAGIHRNLGVHISKVKSVNLDSWTPEQVVSLQQMGNSRARAVYEANLPDNFRRPQSDSSLESFVRAKYEHKKYIAREWVPPPLPKVNWEKEIDEEIERQKRKKNKFSTDSKTKITLNTTKQNTEIPQIPKPKSAQQNQTNVSNQLISTNSSNSTSSSPKQINNTSEMNKQSNSVDLLKLEQQTNSNDKNTCNNSDDTFSSFLSGPTVSLSSSATGDKNKSGGDLDPKTEEENFFNQPAPTEKEKTQLTKDSILALYGNTNQTNLFHQPNIFQNQYMPSVPGVAVAATVPAAGAGNFHQNAFVQNLNQPVSATQIQQAFSNFGTPGGVAFNGFNQYIAPSQQQTQFSTTPATAFQNFNQTGVMPVQQNFTMAGGNGSQLFSSDNNFFQPAQCFGIPSIVSQQQQQQQQQQSQFVTAPQGAGIGMGRVVAPPSQNVVPNPFLTQQTPINLQQQFGNLTLNNVQQPAKISTNVWQ